jgi:hypothetical protein
MGSHFVIERSLTGMKSLRGLPSCASRDIHRSHEHSLLDVLQSLRIRDPLASYCFPDGSRGFCKQVLRRLPLTDAVPADSSFVSLAAPLGWNCSEPVAGSSGTITCKKSIVANDESAQFTVVATISCSAPNATAISNTAGVSAFTPPDSDAGNNAQAVSLTVSNPVPVVKASVALSLLPQNNHDMVDVGLAATATDGHCPGPTNFLVQVYSDEDDLAPNGPKFSPDAKDIGVATLRLRQERDGRGDGRVYLIIVKATDTAGGTGFATVTVAVPKSSSAADIDAVNVQAAVAKAFTDGNNGAAPPNYFVIGDGPAIGPKQ